ncbi:hypothetical protein DENSPDRAFT_528475 [Dentipellis sp. KUC8613]|nr:hypothetical protein DENSPDRAFT_528475 [Dentipellis sp. KUC8613]
MLMRSNNWGDPCVLSRLNPPQRAARSFSLGNCMCTHTISLPQWLILPPKKHLVSYSKDPFLSTPLKPNLRQRSKSIAMHDVAVQRCILKRYRSDTTTTLEPMKLTGDETRTVCPMVSSFQMLLDALSWDDLIPQLEQTVKCDGGVRRYCFRCSTPAL